MSSYHAGSFCEWLGKGLKALRTASKDNDKAIKTSGKRADELTGSSKAYNLNKTKKANSIRGVCSWSVKLYLCPPVS